MSRLSLNTQADQFVPGTPTTQQSSTDKQPSKKTAIKPLNPDYTREQHITEQLCNQTMLQTLSFNFEHALLSLERQTKLVQELKLQTVEMHRAQYLRNLEESSV